MGRESNFTLSQRTADWLDLSDLSLHGPALDFDGFWLFSPLRQGSVVRGIKAGFSIGRYEGSDLRLATPGDPNNVRYYLELITEEESIVYSSSHLSRIDVSSAPNRFDIIVGPLARITGAWPNFQFEMSSPNRELGIRLNFNARSVHWWPDIVMPKTTYKQYVLPDVEINGTVTWRGKVSDVSAVGAFDRPFGRLVPSPTSRGIGYWHYDVIMWDEKFTTVSWLVTNGEGKPYIAYGLGQLGQPDVLLFEDFKIEYADFEERGQGQLMPRKWRGTLTGEDGQLVYTVNAVGQIHESTRENSPRWPTLLMHCEAQFTNRAGEVSLLKGLGLPEYHVAHLPPLVR